MNSRINVNLADFITKCTWNHIRKTLPSNQTVGD